MQYIITELINYKNVPFDDSTLQQWFPDVKIQVGSPTKIRKLNHSICVIVSCIQDLPLKSIEVPVIVIAAKPPKNYEVEWISSKAPLATIKRKLIFLYKSFASQQSFQNNESYVSYLAKHAVLGKLTQSSIHDLNNSLQVILGFTQELQESFATNTQPYKDLTIIFEEVQRSCNILKNIRWLRTADTDDSYQDINLVIENVIPLLNYKIREKNLTLKRDLSQDMGFIEGNAEKIHTAIIALLLIAFGKCEANSKVCVAGRNIDDSIVLEVRFATQNESEELRVIEAYLKQLIICDSCIDGSTVTYTLTFKRFY